MALDKPPSKAPTGDQHLSQVQAPRNNAIFGAAQEAYKPPTEIANPVIAAANAAPLMNEKSVFKDVKAAAAPVPKMELEGVVAADMKFSPAKAMSNRQTDDRFFDRVAQANKGKLDINDKTHMAA